MLSNEEKEEMLRDVKNKRRRNLFRAVKTEEKVGLSMDEYISFLNNVQKIFTPFETYPHPTPTALNKL